MKQRTDTDQCRVCCKSSVFVHLLSLSFFVNFSPSSLKLQANSISVLRPIPLDRCLTDRPGSNGKYQVESIDQYQAEPSTVIDQEHFAEIRNRRNPVENICHQCESPGKTCHRCNSKDLPINIL